MSLFDAARDGRILAARSLSDDERFGPAWQKLAADGGCGALLAVPLETPRNKRAGVTLVFYDAPHTFTNEDLELARHLAGAARGALERSDLFESERASQALAQQLARTGALLATELDPAAVLDEVVQHGPALLAADATAIWLVEGDELVIEAAVGPGSEAALGVRAPATGWLSGDVFQSRTPIALEEVDDERVRELDPLLGVGRSAYLGVPLVGPEGTLHGVLTVYADGPRTWREEEVEALRALAANTSAALSNAELYQRVALEKEQSTAILANIADGIVAVDREGSVVLWNAAAEEITGVPATEALGRSPAQVLQRDLGAGLDAPLGDRLVPILKGGEETWLSVTEAVMRDPAGAVAGRIFAFRDISGDRLVEQMKSEFVSAVSHELRAPLTSIYGFAQTLLREDVAFGSEERRTFLGYIASETERLTMIVDALLNVARLDTGDLQVDLAATDVRALVSDVVATVEQSVLDGHSFVLDLPPESEPLAAEVDPEKLRQVLVQLLDNAVKYSPEGGRVTVAARRKTDTVEFAVVDEGIGIPTGERERIFRKFYRAEGSGGRSGGGTGLGLFIVQRLVEAMGGQVRVDSTEGRGSAFTVELPAAASVSPVGT
jgi:PAS domain S-box-containing protein